MVNTVIECPEGKLLDPDNLSPITLKVFPKAAAGLGIAKKAFIDAENISENSEAVINDSHNLGA
jgi:hypothetical protein